MKGNVRGKAGLCWTCFSGLRGDGLVLLARSIWITTRKRRKQLTRFGTVRQANLKGFPPYAEPCPILNANFNGFDWDDFTPVEYVQRQMKTKWLGCFSESDLRDDENMLKRMTFMKESKIFVTGSGDSRDFGFHFRSNPIPVAKVTVHGYGLLDGITEAETPPLAIHAGDTYSQSRVSRQEASLREAYEKPDWQLKVFTDVQITPKGEAVLEFSLLAYPDDAVYVNDKKYDVTHYSEK